MSVRETTLEVLYAVTEENRRLSVVREEFFNHQKISAGERPKITSLTAQVTRWQGRLDYWLKRAVNRSLVSLQDRLLIILRIATYELLIDRHEPDYAIINSAVELAGKRVGKHTKGLANAVLRKVAGFNPEKVPGKRDLATSSAWNSFPEWLWQRWEQRFGRELTVELAENFNSYPQLTIRRNSRRIATDDLVAELGKSGITIDHCDDEQRFFRVKGGGQTLRQHELLRNGTVSFQDRAAGAVVEILDPRPVDQILDVCAAPGTKSLYIAELMGAEAPGRLFAYDADARRVALGKSDIQRHGCSAINWKVADASKHIFPLADGILVDAPCSGTGVIGRRPDIRWRRKEDQIGEFAELQLTILRNVANYLKPGGRLVYATCSLEPEENWQLVEAFLKLVPQFVVEKIDHLIPAEWVTENQCMQTFPPRHKVDGIFAVRMGKQC